jgi:hypothetical protein
MPLDGTGLSHVYSSEEVGPLGLNRAASEPPNHHDQLQIMRTLKESPKRDKIKPLKDPVLKQQIAKLVQRAR